jgi:hypothetical protein
MLPKLASVQIFGRQNILTISLNYMLIIGAAGGTLLSYDNISLFLPQGNIP